MTATFNKTLIIRFSSIGDIVLSSLLVRAFRARFPNTQLDFCVREEFAELVQHNPNLSNVLTLPRSASFADLQSLRSRIRDNGYALIIDIHDSLRSRYVSWGTAHVVRINKRKLARFLLVKFKWNVYESLGGSPSVALRYLETVEQFGVHDDGNGLDLFFAEEARHRVDAFIRNVDIEPSTSFIGISPSAKHNTKIWLTERFAEAGAILSAQRIQPIALFGSAEERERCEEIANQIKKHQPNAVILNLAGKISLSETAAMMDRCSLVLTNDSGLMHIAAARKRKVAAIFGSTVKELGFFPVGTEHAVVENKELGCRPCTHIGLAACPKGHFKCMSDIPVDDVVRAARSLLNTSAQ